MLYSMGHRSTFLNYDAFLARRFVFIFANNADSDEMLKFHLGHGCLSKYLFEDFQD